MMVSPALLSPGGGGGGGGGGGAFTVNATPGNVYGGRAFSGPVTVTTEAATAVPSGTPSGDTYLWSVVSAPTGTWTIISPTSATTQFSCSDVDEFDSFTATFKCTVTRGGDSVASNNVEATVTNVGGGGL